MRSLYILLFFFLFIIQINAQTHRDTVRQTAKRWSIETSIVWPVYPGVYRINFIRQVWEKKTFSGEIGFALNLQPERTDLSGNRFSEEFVTIIYRQFFWKGFHIEVDNNFAYGRLNNWQSAGVSYESYAIFHDFIGGYRFELLKKHKVSLTIIPQAGGGFTSYVNSTWPRAELPFWEVNLLVGMRF